MSWVPLLDKGERATALRIVHGIADELRVLPSSSLQGLKGDVGQAVLLVYADAAGVGDDLSDAAALKLDAGLTALGHGTATAALWTGVAGVSWALTHLGEGDASTAAHELLDSVIERRLAVDEWTEPYDLISGLVGLGIAVLERLADPRGRRIAESVLGWLEALACPVADGLAWRTDVRHLRLERRAQFPGEEFELAIAHGITGIVALCAGWVALDFERTRSMRLLEGAVRWTLDVAARNDLTTCEGWLGVRGYAPMPLSWCNGGPGVAIALFAAARALDDERLEAVGLELMRTIAGRPIGERDVPDAAFCHGAAGVAHIFNRLYQATGESTFRAAALAWIERILAMRRPGQGIAGFSAWKPAFDGGTWESDPTLISGATGIGLVLLAAASSLEPAWDSVFLVGTPAILRMD